MNNSMIAQWTRAYEQSHASVARLLAQESGIQVIVDGDGFANSSDFQILEIVRQSISKSSTQISMDVLQKASSEVAKKYRTQKNRGGNSLNKSTIYMPAIPPDSSPQMQRALDGGLLHEIFHSLYTTRGTPDLNPIFNALSSVWDPHKIKKVSSLIPTFWNVFEDVMIERKGCNKFLGAPPLLQAVHEYIWVREADVNFTPQTRGWYVATSICYLRDYCKSLVYLNNTPVYDDEIRNIYSQEIYDLALAAESTCDTLIVAIKALYQLWDYIEDEECEKEDQGDPEDEDSSTPGEDDKGSDGEEKGNKDPSDKGSPGIPLDDDETSGEDDDETSTEGSASEDEEGEGEASEEKDGEGDSSTSDNEQEMEGEAEAEGADDSTSEQEGGGASRGGEETEPLSEKDIEGLEDDMSKVVEDALKHAWEHVFQEGRKEGRIIRPTTIRDIFEEARASGSDQMVRKLNSMIQPQLARMRPPIIGLLQNKDKMVRKPYQETGRSLSTRSLNTVLAQKPRPFEQRYQEHAEKSCVLILIDLSGSMQIAMDTAAASLLAVSHILHGLNIPFGIIGFTSKAHHVGSSGGYTHTDQLILTVAKDFTEKFSSVTQKRIAGLQPLSATPLPDMFDLGVQLLKARSEKNKHLWVISDGAPYYGSDCTVDTLHLLKKRMEASTLTTKPFLLNVDIGGKSTHTSHLTHTQTIRSFDQVPAALMNHLKNK